MFGWGFTPIFRVDELSSLSDDEFRKTVLGELEILAMKAAGITVKSSAPAPVAAADLVDTSVLTCLMRKCSYPNSSPSLKHNTRKLKRYELKMR